MDIEFPGKQGQQLKPALQPQMTAKNSGSISLKLSGSSGASLAPSASDAPTAAQWRS